jgi:polysaccharide pyruvyl transferase WcaK-like protein
MVKQTKFLLLGHGGFFNRGCEAIVKTTIMMLRSSLLDNNKIIITSVDFKNDKKIMFDKNIKIIPALLTSVWKRGHPLWIMRQFSRLCSKRHALEIEYWPVVSAIKKADIILSIGGDNFTMDFDYPPEYVLNTAKSAKARNKKFIIWSASIGPFPEKHRSFIDIVNTLKSVDLITVRESASLTYLKKIGISDNVKQVADVAFLLEPEEISLDNLSLSYRHKDFLGVNVSPLLAKYRNHNEDIIIKEVVGFLKKVIMETDFGILLISHVNKHYSSNNDYEFLKKIYNSMPADKRITLLPCVYNAMQIKSIISKCRFFIGGRTHATIASLSSLVPTLSIGYSLKSIGINQDIFGNGDYLLRVGELTEGTLWSKFVLLNNRESQVRAILANKIPEMERMAWLNMQYLKDVIEK